MPVNGSLLVDPCTCVPTIASSLRSIRQRVSLLLRGLCDRSPEVRRACQQALLRDAWLERECEGDVVALLVKMDVEEGEGERVGEMLLTAMMEEGEGEGVGDGGDEKDAEGESVDEEDEMLERDEREGQEGAGTGSTGLKGGCVVDWRAALLERGVAALLAAMEEGTTQAMTCCRGGRTWLERQSL